MSYNDSSAYWKVKQQRGSPLVKPLNWEKKMARFKRSHQETRSPSAYNFATDEFEPDPTWRMLHNVNIEMGGGGGERSDFDNSREQLDLGGSATSPDFSKSGAFKPRLPPKMTKKKVNYVDIVMESARSGLAK